MQNVYEAVNKLIQLLTFEVCLLSVYGIPSQILFDDPILLISSRRRNKEHFRNTQLSSFLPFLIFLLHTV